MTKPKAKQPLESFDPRLIPLLLKGGRERIVIPFPGPQGKALAHKFQRRIHTLRSRMRQTNHEQAANVSRCVVRLLWGAKAVEEGLDTSVDQMSMCDDLGRLGAWIVIQPTDLEFSAILSKIDLSAGAPAMECPDCTTIYRNGESQCSSCAVKLRPAPSVPPQEPLTQTQEADLETFLDTLKEAEK